MQTAFGVPFDPFQGARKSAADPFVELLRQWTEVTRRLDDDGMTLSDGRAEDARRDRLWDEREAIEKEALLVSRPSLVGLLLKLRAVARSLNIECAFCANHDGERTNELTENEILIASAIADTERLKD